MSNDTLLWALRYNTAVEHMISLPAMHDTN